KGEVAFYDGATELGRANLDATGSARFEIAGLNVGTHPLRAEYEGGDNHESGASEVLALAVNRAASSASLVSSSNPSAVGEVVTYTATVTSNVVGVSPTGGVSFTAGGLVLGSASLDASCVATVTTGGLAVGTH